jgi:hypothetical protein
MLLIGKRTKEIGPAGPGIGLAFKPATTSAAA